MCYEKSVSNSGRVLVVDDEKNITFVIQAMLEMAGYEAVVFNDSAGALKAIDQQKLDAVITDLYMPGPGGMDLLEHCKKAAPELPVVIVTAYGTIESAVAALKRGAFDYVTKPFDQTELLNVARKAVQTHQQRQKEPMPAAATIIGQSARMQEIFRVIGKIAASPSTVLITGESGTGKELVAYEIHRGSDRAKKPFIKINCAAIPATLIESELFGHEKGAFTGAVTAKPGRFELADEGTRFLDEVAELALDMQVKLLRVLQEQEFERVGGVNTIKVNVRIITATNRLLEEEVKTGRFREDLFYRLNVLPVQLPPLRERREDIDALVQYFLKQFNEKLGKRLAGISPVAMAALRGHAWPGNIRQLENALERMVLMADGPTIELKDLPPEIAAVVGGLGTAGDPDSDGPTSLKEIVKRQTQTLEKDLIEKALEETGGNVTRAAERLGLSRKGLQLKIKELGLKRVADGPADGDGTD